MTEHSVRTLAARKPAPLAIVTGAAGTIGSAVCEQLLTDGYIVAALDLGESMPAAAGRHRRLRRLSCDMSDKAAVEAVVREAETAYGPVEALVNVAGVVSKGSALLLDEEELDRVLRVNVKGTLFACQIVGRRMMEQRSGAIVNMGSAVGKNGGNPRPWLDNRELGAAANIAYGMSKAAVHAMTFFLAKELAAYGVRVNAVAPGPIATAMTGAFPDALKSLVPLGRMGRPEEVAAVVGFLLSYKASFITGEIIDVNGGIWCD
ncbi:MAG: SDR family oxidoreductase [Pseudomonadota bacterium]